jgi:hypothetical protein
MVQGLRSTLIFRYQDDRGELDRRTRILVSVATPPAVALGTFVCLVHSQNVSVMSLAGIFSTTPPFSCVYKAKIDD